jgi:hypothetical protein
MTVVNKKVKSNRDKVREARNALQAATKRVLDIGSGKLADRLAAKEAELAAQTRLVNVEQKKYTEFLKDTSKTKQQRDVQLGILQTAQTNRRRMVEDLTNLREQSFDSISSTAIEAAVQYRTLAERVTATAVGDYGAISNPSALGLQYNASSVNEAYFSSTKAFNDRLMTSRNKPGTVSAANQLWSTSKGSKGMIVMSEQVLKAWNSGGARPGGGGKDPINYGFQFQYNPGTVAMSYFTSPNVDVTMMTSGTEMFNLAGVSGSQGSIGFQVIINRIFDMQYITSAGTLKSGYSLGNLYPKQPSVAELRDIHAKGTMYDVEYLLRVLMGTTMKSYLRGDNTADMGWLPAIPVELHLGKSLRYLGTVNSVNLSHMIFDERMVPLFTTVDIAFARLPDYPANTNGPTGTGGAGNKFPI